MKILITGARGMLAQAVREKFQSENELFLTDSKELDITDEKVVSAKIAKLKPEVVINCAAYTAVDKAELQSELAEKVNADGPGNLARACAENNAILVHISTDYVFGGLKPVDEEYSEDDEKSPASVYGKTKLSGERQIEESGCKFYIFRTAWLYGDGPNFVRTMLNASESRNEVSVVNDQFGSPTNTADLTDIIYQAITKQIPFGIYNATNLGFTNWADFTKKIYELAGVKCKVRGITSEEYEKQAMAKAGDDYKVAPRPKNSKLSKAKLLSAGIKIPKWEDSLKVYLAKEGKLLKEA